MGATFIILMGSIDLSVEGVMTVGATIVALLCANDANSHDFGWWGPLLALAACTGLGVLNGLVHVGLRIPSFMATIGLWFVGLGVGTVALGGSAVSVQDKSVRFLAFERVLGLPLAVWIAVAAFLSRAADRAPHPLRPLHLCDRRRRGHCEALGRSGQRTRIVAFTLAGFFTGLAAVLAAAQLGQANTTIADGRLFMTVTAVVVGGTALTGGVGGVASSLVGVMIVAV